MLVVKQVRIVRIVQFLNLFISNEIFIDTI
jgi:hypothetical protein